MQLYFLAFGLKIIGHENPDNNLESHSTIDVHQSYEYTIFRPLYSSLLNSRLGLEIKFALKMETTGSPEALVSIYQTALNHVPEVS
jgi:hypothetical protein